MFIKLGVGVWRYVPQVCQNICHFLHIIFIWNHFFSSVCLFWSFLFLHSFPLIQISLHVTSDGFWFVLIHTRCGWDSRQVTAIEAGQIKTNFLPKAGGDSSKSTLPHIRSARPIAWQQLSQSSSWLAKRWRGDGVCECVWVCVECRWWWLRVWGGGLLRVKWSQSQTEKQHYTPH